MIARWISTTACVLHLMVACVCLRVVGPRGSPISFGPSGISHIIPSGWRNNMTFDVFRLSIWGLAVGHCRRMSWRLLPGIGHLRNFLICLLCLTLGILHISWVLGIRGSVPRWGIWIHLVIGLEGLLGKLDFGILLKSFSILVNLIPGVSEVREKALHNLRLSDLLFFLRQQVGHGFTLQCLDVLLLEL
jgi:hypothetical protein